ncbi:alpha/beta fold hydrolase [Streptomyces sp. NBC_01262]|uniref:alpha/beta fold hydrolase n=1 Tax=Streptomyces sp. NBC_01262 TaxID=2903803 RepID=UPI003FCD7898
MPPVAADVPENLSAFMADSQVRWGVDALEGTVSEPAWQTKPSWYLVATDDRIIPPPAQRAMSERTKATVSETPGSHAVYVSRPAVVAAVIAQTAEGLNGQVWRTRARQDAPDEAAVPARPGLGDHEGRESQRNAASGRAVRRPAAP